MASQQLLNELNIILKEDFERELERSELVEVANNFISYFDLLAKINIEKEENTYDKNINL